MNKILRSYLPHEKENIANLLNFKVLIKKRKPDCPYRIFKNYISDQRLTLVPVERRTQ